MTVSLERQFNSLLNHYYATIEIAQEHGNDGQDHINRTHRDLMAFAKKHPEFNARVPKKSKFIEMSFREAMAWQHKKV